MNHLDKKDRQLLYELDCNSRISFADLGKCLKMTPEAIRYRFQRLQSDGILKSCYAIIDSGKLGFMQYKLFLKFQSVTEEDVDTIVKYARSAPMALRVIRFDGAYNLDIICKVVNASELDRFITTFIGKFSRFIQKRSVAVNAWARYVPRNYFIGRDRTKYFDRGYGTSAERFELDRTNTFILRMLSTDSRASATEIAEGIENEGSLVPISSFAVGKRIESLIRAKVITGFAISINNDSLGQVMFKNLLSMNSLSEAESKRFIAYCLRHPHVVHLIKTIGEWDYELDIEARDVKALQQIMMALTREFPRAVQDYVSLDNMKIFKYRFLEMS